MTKWHQVTRVGHLRHSFSVLTSSWIETTWESYKLRAWEFFRKIAAHCEFSRRRLQSPTLQKANVQSSAFRLPLPPRKLKLELRTAAILRLRRVMRHSDVATLISFDSLGQWYRIRDQLDAEIPKFLKSV
ncbi:MAG: hypothetical protein QOH71_1827 [Blastocatellia bacterium]|jgi:hypothetical protein|nr:hypothetical protein [Blastocatellia bacterium]